jgi:hypothetical protein
LNLGTPGLANSRTLAHPGPAITEVSHLPVLPAASQTVAVSARASSPDALTNLVLKYRLDPSPSYTSVVMVDTGTNGDSFSGDGLYTGRIPGQASGQLVAFYIEAVDSVGVTNRFPFNAPARECLVRFGESQPAGTLGTYRLWLTKTNQDLWTSREKLSNEPLDCTFVYGSQRAIYNAGALYSGSAHTSQAYYNSPTNNICGYKVEFPSDDRFLGATDCVLDWPIRDRTGQREQLGYWMASQLGLQFHHRRFVHLVVNGMAESGRPLPDSDGTKIYEDVQQPGGDTVDQWFPTNTDGHLYKFDIWIERSPITRA